MISFVTPTQGNPIALKRTIESVKHICDDFIIGSVCLFDDDVETIKSYGKEYPLRVIDLPFNFIYKMGFAATLNALASFAKNDIVVYLNVGEIIESSENEILSIINNEYNCYYIDHAIERHRWFRVWNRNEMKWSGRIHEEIVGEHKPYHRPLFRFADTEKDMNDKFKAAVNNDVKEIVYWHQLIKIAKEPEVHLGATSIGWVNFAKENLQTMQDRLAKKGNRPAAFELHKKEMYLLDIYTNPEFEKERFESNHIIEFQGSPMYLNKKQ